MFPACRRLTTRVGGGPVGEITLSPHLFVVRRERVMCGMRGSRCQTRMLICAVASPGDDPRRPRCSSRLVPRRDAGVRAETGYRADLVAVLRLCGTRRSGAEEVGHLRCARMYPSLAAGDAVGPAGFARAGRVPGRRPDASRRRASSVPPRRRHAGVMAILARGRERYLFGPRCPTCGSWRHRPGPTVAISTGLGAGHVIAGWRSAS